MSEDKRKILIVEDDPGLLSQMRWALEEFDACLAEDRAAAQAAMEKENPDVVILDLGLPPDPNGASEGLAALESILSLKPTAKVIIASGNEVRENAVKAISIGAYDFYPKPVDIDVLRLIIQRALHLYDLEEENRRLSDSDKESPLSGIITASPEMLKVCRMVERVASSEVSVLITGESGTGKEVLARALHNLSARESGPFIAINCAAIPENLLESELFGHEKGAFTGAIKQTMGKVEQASQGTLFLDEIGDMPTSLQAKLLRFLQERTIERIGGRKEIEVDVRIVSATNQNLDTAMHQGNFREDLFYRLNEVGVRIPPLRERAGDAIMLAKYFLRKFGNEIGRPDKGFTTESLTAIGNYGWPGNVRELESRLKRAVVLADGKLITVDDLDIGGETVRADFPTMKETREQAEIDSIKRAMQLTRDNVSLAAKMLGISRPTLYDLMKTYDLRK